MLQFYSYFSKFIVFFSNCFLATYHEGYCLKKNMNLHDGQRLFEKKNKSITGAQTHMHIRILICAHIL